MRPADLGYTMPAEWAPHRGCWMAWPKRTELWREHLDAARGRTTSVLPRPLPPEP